MPCAAGRILSILLKTISDGGGLAVGVLCMAIAIGYLYRLLNSTRSDAAISSTGLFGAMVLMIGAGIAAKGTAAAVTAIGG